MAERLLHKRYQLQRVLTQGQVCTIYLAFDQVLQRAVTVKIIPAEYIAVYKASIRLTAQFSHANIIGTYDFIQEPDVLYLVQEYVDGDNFGNLLQTQLSPHAVADFGVQLCQALLYAGGSTRGVCHGDITPSAIIRDRRGLVRINDFALPTDVQYFASWSLVGGNGNAVSDTELPWGTMSDGRRADDTRAVGLLLYQLLSGRPSGATSVEPPMDGRLRFLRNVRNYRTYCSCATSPAHQHTRSVVRRVTETGRVARTLHRICAGKRQSDRGQLQRKTISPTK